MLLIDITRVKTALGLLQKKEETFGLQFLRSYF